MRVALFEPAPADATSFYRSRGVWHYLSKEHPELKFIIPTGSDWIDAVLYDVAIFQRPCTKKDVRAITMMKDCGVKVIIDYDDNLLNVAPHNPSYEHHHFHKVSTMGCINLADIVIVSTEKLKESYLPYNKNIVVIPNALNDYIFNKKKPFKNSKIAYYRGGSSHQRDVYLYRNEIIKTVRENPDWKFYFFGDRFQFLEAELSKDNNFLMFGYMPILQFLQSITELRPAAHFTFLEDTPFNQAKSNCSWIEATYAGAASFAPEKLAEFYKVPGLDLEEAYDLNNATSILEESHDHSWMYIQDNLLLSQVNKKRLELL